MGLTIGAAVDCKFCFALAIPLRKDFPLLLHTAYAKPSCCRPQMLDGPFRNQNTVRREKKPSLPHYHHLCWQILSSSVATLLSSHISNAFLSLLSHTFTFLTFPCPEVLLTSSHPSSQFSLHPKISSKFHRIFFFFTWEGIF